MWDGDLMDPVTKVLIETIGDAGYLIDIAGDGQGGYTVTAVARRGGEPFVVELAEQIGIELEDG